MLNSAFTRPLRVDSRIESIQFLVLTPIFLGYILILSSRVRLSLPRGLFSVGLPIKILNALLPSSILATFPVNINLLDLITLSEWHKL